MSVGTLEHDPFGGSTWKGDVRFAVDVALSRSLDDDRREVILNGRCFFSGFAFRESDRTDIDIAIAMIRNTELLCGNIKPCVVFWIFHTSGSDRNGNLARFEVFEVVEVKGEGGGRLPRDIGGGFGTLLERYSVEIACRALPFDRCGVEIGVVDQ